MLHHHRHATAQAKKAAGDGPSAEQRAALMQQAMGQATITKPKRGGGAGPSAEQRAALMNQAQAS